MLYNGVHHVRPGAIPITSGRFRRLIKEGTVYDGTGADLTADVAIRGDRIVGIGDFKKRRQRKTVINAKGIVVAPGFINMLSWSHRVADPGRPLAR